MAQDLYSQNNNEINNSPYMPDGYEKTTQRKRLLLIVVGVIVGVGLIVVVAFLLLSPSAQDKYNKAATAAARKVTPNAVVNNVKVAGSFAVATVSDPTAKGQAKAGNATIFKVNKDGSMTQIANGSYFSPTDLLGLGIPLATQATLAGRNLAQVQKDLAGECGYTSGNVPGYIGFNGSFNPGGWKIDALTLSGLEQTLSDTISAQNARAKTSGTVICVNATRKNSNKTTDAKTFISTFTLQVQFIKGDGTITSHTLTFSNGHYRTYTLDGQKM